MRKQLISVIFVAVTLLKCPILLAEPIPDYHKVSKELSGDLISIGSDTLAHLMELWMQEFKRLYPHVNIHIEYKGSSTAPPALIEGRSQIGPMSRKMKKAEIAAFVKKYGYKPTFFRVAIEAVAVYVNKRNPLHRGLTIQQVDAIFSATRKCSAKQEITTWGQLGLVGIWANHPIKLYGRNALSGTHSFFQTKALCKGTYKKTIHEELEATSVIQAVSRSVDGIGYSGAGFKTPDVRVLALAKGVGHSFLMPSKKNTLCGKYPLTRFLYIYVNIAPNQPPPPLVTEFIKMILSNTGQGLVKKAGHIPLHSKFIQRELRKWNSIITQ